MSKPIKTSPGAGKLLSHNVFFKIAKSNDEERKKLVDACNELLSGHEGVVSFSVGILASEFDREVNDLDFDVALHILFLDIAAHDAYQIHPRHTQFVEENKASWSKVRVFDSWVNHLLN